MYQAARRSRPLSSAARTVDGAMSSTWDPPAANVPVLLTSVSNPVTWKPASTAAIDTGSPT